MKKKPEEQIELKIFHHFDEKLLSGSNVFSFLNLYSIQETWKEPNRKNLNYFCDGGALAFLIKCLTRKKICRVSFDFTSIAEVIFDHCACNNKSIYFLGAKQQEIHKFVGRIAGRFPNLNIVGYSDGYFQDMAESIATVISNEPDIVVVGLGAGLQETYLNNLIDNGFCGIGFSCGGFIRQYSQSREINYYPNWINKFRLRALYRMKKEPHTIHRYLFEYPRNLIKLTLLHLKKELVLDIK